MYETGSGIIPHPTSMQAESCIAKFGSGHSRDTNIDRHGLHMQAVLSYAVPVGAKIFVAPRSSITAHNIDLGIRTPERYGQIVQKIKHPRIVYMHIASPVIA